MIKTLKDLEALPAEARAFALGAHGDQKYGDKPYSFHLDSVAGLVRPYGEWCEAVAYLHDVVEDTPVEHYDIWKHFGDPVAACVYLVTDPADPLGRMRRKDKKAKVHEKLADVRYHGRYPEALIVKVADRLANVRACWDDGKWKKGKMYVMEHKPFRKAAYHPGLCDDLWKELDALIEKIRFMV